MEPIGIVGTGFVADLYMRSLATFPSLKVASAFDIDEQRCAAFCHHWKILQTRSLEEFLWGGPEQPRLVLNLTNPSSHFDVSLACLQAGRHVYSEKPLALDMKSAQALRDLAAEKSLLLASAPCSVLGEAAQTLWLAIRKEAVGQVHLVYAELDDDFISQAPFKKWRSESGAPWPYRDEFVVGCTLEHAGYYLTWLIAMFGSVKKVVAASATLIQDKLEDCAQTGPDYSCATLFFESGIVARLTCSIVAPHDHSLRIFGDKGVLEVARSWDNDAPIRLRRRYTIRRKLLNSPITKRIKIKTTSHPKVGRWGAAAMNFALGPAEMLNSLQEARPCRLSADFALHLNEVTLAIQSSNGVQHMRTVSPPIEPMSWAKNLK